MEQALCVESQITDNPFTWYMLGSFYSGYKSTILTSLVQLAYIMYVVHMKIVCPAKFLSVPKHQGLRIQR